MNQNPILKTTGEYKSLWQSVHEHLEEVCSSIWRDKQPNIWEPLQYGRHQTALALYQSHLQNYEKEHQHVLENSQLEVTSVSQSLQNAIISPEKHCLIPALSDHSAICRLECRWFVTRCYWRLQYSVGRYGFGWRKAGFLEPVEPRLRLEKTVWMQAHESWDWGLDRSLDEKIPRFLARRSNRDLQDAICGVLRVKKQHNCRPVREIPNDMSQVRKQCSPTKKCRGHGWNQRWHLANGILHWYFRAQS